MNSNALIKAIAANIIVKTLRLLAYASIELKKDTPGNMYHNKMFPL